MSTVYNQTVACRFGVELVDLLANDYWTRFDAAVAWVRRSGLRHIRPALIDFLQRGGVVRFVVGIDIENTSREGLEDLLALAQHGTIQTLIRHNEHPSVTFHPKVYLFTNDEHARLIVGSNNLTESGLFTNTEAGLQVDGAVTDAVIVQMRAAIDSWAETEGNLARVLDQPLLTALETAEYIATEETLQRRRATARSRSARAGGGRRPAPLFGSRAEVAPPAPAAPTAPAPPAPTATTGAPAAPAPRRPRRPSSAPQSGIGTVLLIRPNLQRGTQMQVPIILRNGPFLSSVNEMVSDHDGVARPMSPARSGGKVNTIKMELPESRTINNPVMRVWRAEDGTIRYRVFDQDSPQGRFIAQRLEEGRHTTPPETTMTRPSDPDRSTLYRFI
jgi:HKD family nuclease